MERKPEYTKVKDMEVNGLQVWFCKACGSLVADVERHTEWHRHYHVGSSIGQVTRIR